LFEGELTLLELADLLSTGKDWRDIQGVAYCKMAWPSATNAAAASNLDTLPLPERDFKTDVHSRSDIMPLIASRGCSRKFLFVRYTTFYRAVPGKIVRLRKTVMSSMK